MTTGPGDELDPTQPFTLSDQLDDDGDGDQLFVTDVDAARMTKLPPGDHERLHGGPPAED